MAVLGGICNQGSGKRRDSDRYKMQRRCGFGSREDHREQAAEIGGQQKDSICRPKFWHGKSLEIFVGLSSAYLCDQDLFWPCP